MKKILLFITGLMLAVCASAQVYLRGNGDASYSVNEEFLFTDNGDGTHTLTKSFELKSDFKIATSDWSVFNFGSAGEEAKVGTIRVLNGTDNNVSVSSLINVTSMTLDTNANTLTIVGENAGEITYSSWTICGVGELLGDAWYPASTINVMTESDGVYTLIKKNVSLSSDFITDADNPEKATLGYGYKVVADAQWGIKEYPADGTNKFVKISKDGIYDIIFTFNPSTKELSASTTLISESGSGNDNVIKDDGYINGIYYKLDHINKTAEVTYRGESDYDYDEYSGSIIIPASINFNSESYSVTSIGFGAFRGCSGLTSVRIPNSVTSIGESAFDDCQDLTSVTIPNSVTSIGSAAFRYCHGLTSINIPSSVTSISSDAFNESGIYHNKYNWENGALYISNCLIEVNNIGDSYSVKEGTRLIADNAFCHCDDLTSVTISNSVTTIGQGSLWCDQLTKIIVLSNNEHFSSDNGVLFNKDKTVLLQYPINKKDKTYSIPNSVTSIGESAFYYCQALTSVTIPNSVTSIGESAFYHCQALTSVTIPNSVTSIGESAFSGCSDLISVIWEAKNCADFNNTIFGGVSHADITSFIFGNEVEHIPADLCKGIKSLKEVVIGSNVTSIGDDAFNGCSGLASVTIPNSVTSIGYGAFSGCSGLTKVNYLGTVDKWVEIDFHILANPTYYAKDLYINNELLTDVRITYADSIKDNAFYYCESIKSVEIGNNVTFIGSGAFYDCTNLSKVNYLGTVDEWIAIDCNSNPTYYAKDLYINDELLTDVKITSVDSIRGYAFDNCKSIKSVEIGNSVTYVGEGSFYNCSGLTSVSIGESVEHIAHSAFLGCENLKKVTAYPTTVPTAYESSFDHYNAYLYIPCDYHENYDLDDVFGYFKYIKCIAAKEVASPEQVEIEVDEDNNANVIWPSTDGAKKYELEISKNGEVFCTLLFNENGQLTSIDFGKRSASVGFQFTVTGLDGASKYNYSIAAKDEVENVLDSYKGTFTTNGYVQDPDEEDVPTSITDAIDDANITISNGLITCPDTEFAIYNTIGQDVTAFNGSLQPGVYLVSIENNIVKVMVK